jgi:RNA polymerase sigma factor (sigma-70 family)
VSCPASPSPGPAASSGLGPIRELEALEERHADRSFADLREKVVAGDDEAWRDLVEKYSRFVWTVALRLLAGSRGDREEQVQETYRRVFERLRRDDFRLLRGFRGRCRFSTYLYRMVQTARSDVQRREIRDREHAEPVDFTDEVNRKIEAAMAETANGCDAGTGPAFAGEGRPSPELIRGEVERIAAALDPRERILVKLRFRKGLKLRELATTLGYRDTNDAAYALRKALKRLGAGALLGTDHWTEDEREMVREALRAALLE